MEEIKKAILRLNDLINDEKSNYYFNRSTSKDANKDEIKRLKHIRRQIKTGNFGTLTDPIKFLIGFGAVRACIDYRIYTVSSISCLLESNILNCIRCANADYSILDCNGNVLKRFVDEKQEYDEYTIYFGGSVPRNLYRFLNEKNYKLNYEGERTLIYNPKKGVRNGKSL